MRTLRRLGSLLLISGAVLLGAATLAPPVSAAAPVYNATLKVAHIGSTNPGFGTGSCPAAGWGWHFVLQGSSTTFIAIKATFQNAGDITTFISSPTAKHAYVFTPGPDTLLGAVAEVSGPDLDFNLSHVCTGPAVTTTVPEVTTTVPEGSTTVPEGSTTVPEVTTTVPEGSTTVPEVTTTVPEGSTTVPEVTTTVPGETTTVPEVTTTVPTSVLPTSSIVESTSTTQPTEVLSETTTPSDPTAATTPVVSNATLARTGSNTQALAVIGMALLLFGSVLLLRSRRLGNS